MDAFLAYTILGLSLGAAYAVAAAGLVVTYTTSGVFNLAHGGVAMLAAYAYWQLRFDDGWGGQWPAPLAVIVVVFVLGPAAGLLLERTVMRNLRHTSEATRVVITVAVLLACTGVANWVWSGSESRVPEYFFGATNQVSSGLPVAVLWHDVTVLATAGVLTAALFWVLYRTPLGVRMRAVVDSTSLVQLNGFHPEAASRASWMLGTGMAALAGVLLSPRLGALSPLALTLLVANVFAAAVFGRLRSLQLTLVGAVAVGLLVNYWTWFQSEVGRDWTWLTNLRPSLPMVLLVLVLLVLPHERLRGATVTRTKERFPVPTMTQAVCGGVAFVVVVWALASLMEAQPQVRLGDGLALGLIALSVVLLTGYSGELNLAPMAFAGVGAIVAYQVDVGPGGRALQESTSVLGVLAAAVVCAGVGALVALPALRLRGLYLALGTFAFAVVVSNLVYKQAHPLALNIPFLGDGEDVEINLFSNGTLSVPRPRWFGVDLTRGPDLRQTAWLVFLATVIAGAGVLLVALRRSSYGLRLTAMKDSPAAAVTLGMNLVRLKLSVFSLSAAMAGVGGVMFASHSGSVTEGDFEVIAGLGLFLLVVVGGVGSVTGGVIGALVFGAGFLAIADVWETLAAEFPRFSGPFGFAGDWFRFVGPAMAGIGLGRNPSGIVAQLADGYRPLTHGRGRSVAAAGGVALAALYVATAADVIDNWTFVIAALAIVLTLPLPARWLARADSGAPTAGGLGRADVAGLERLLVTGSAPTVEQVRALDEALLLAGRAR